MFNSVNLSFVSEARNALVRFAEKLYVTIKPPFREGEGGGGGKGKPFLVQFFFKNEYILVP